MRLLLIALLFLLYGCKKQVDKPIFNLSASENIHSTTFTPLFDNDQFELSGIVLNSVKKNPQIIDVLPLHNDRFLIYDYLAEKLYHWDKSADAVLIAKSGRGPNGVDSGLWFVKDGDSDFLLQRARRSEVICESPENCKLNVSDTFDNIVYYYELRDDGTVITIGNYIPGKPRITIYKDGKSTHAGGFYSHTDNDISREMNGSILVNLKDDKGYIQYFTLSPHIVFMDKDLNVKNVFKLNQFEPIEIVSRKYDRQLTQSFNFDNAFSQVVWHYQMNNGDIILFTSHSEEIALSSHPMDRELIVHRYDYYRFNLNKTTIDYIGSTENYTIPLEEGYLVAKDFMLQFYQNP